LYDNPDDAVGKTIRESDQRYRVIGVSKKKGDREQDGALVVPYKTTFGTINLDKTFFTIYLGVNNKDNVETVKEKAKETLLKRYKSSDFSVTEQTEILSTVNQIFSIVNAILVAIGSISLLVGGIGIMNIMYATVTKGQGINQACSGATQKDIMNQFLAESVLLSLIRHIGSFIFGLIVLGRFVFLRQLISVVLTLVISSGMNLFGVFQHVERNYHL
jgi:putative ABC transport system permease protein